MEVGDIDLEYGQLDRLYGCWDCAASGDGVGVVCFPPYLSLQTFAKRSRSTSCSTSRASASSSEGKMHSWQGKMGSRHPKITMVGCQAPKVLTAATAAVQ